MPQARMHLAEDQLFVIEVAQLGRALHAINSCAAVSEPFPTITEAFRYFHWEPSFSTPTEPRQQRKPETSAAVQSPHKIIELDVYDELDHGDTELLFALVAPFVTPGSYIEIIDERGGNWRYQFDGAAVRVCLPTITWDEGHVLDVAELLAA